MSRTPIERVHPEIAGAIGALDLQLDSDTIALIRTIEFPSVPPSDDVERSDHLVAGDPPVPVRVHRPKALAGPLPCLYSIHGGGYVMGSYSMQDPVLDRLCSKLGIVGITVEYRLAPETSYPGPLEDCYAGLRWAYEHADELGIDRACIGIGGVSAGGGLAAALALLARDRGEVPVAFQLLDCPMLDDRQATRSSQMDTLPVWSRESNEFGWRAYLGDLYGRDDVPYTAAPARATDLTGLPPAFVSVGSIDGFLDEDVEYALRLNHAGVDAELHVYPGACHGYQIAQDSEIAQRSARDVANWLTRQFAR
jgi:acetyl esterase/lipase